MTTANLTPEQVCMLRCMTKYSIANPSLFRVSTRGEAFEPSPWLRLQCLSDTVFNHSPPCNTSRLIDCCPTSPVRPIGLYFHAGVAQLQWAVDSYNLVYAVLLLTGGLLADLHGRRRILMAGTATFTLAQGESCSNKPCACHLCKWELANSPMGYRPTRSHAVPKLALRVRSHGAAMTSHAQS